MFMVDEATAEAIRQAYTESGELSAVVALRRRFPGITDNENARLCVRSIARWKPPSPVPVEKPQTGVHPAELRFYTVAYCTPG
jgi:hypothetical protein